MTVVVFLLNFSLVESEKNGEQMIFPRNKTAFNSTIHYILFFFSTDTRNSLFNLTYKRRPIAISKSRAPSNQQRTDGPTDLLIESRTRD